MPKWTRRKTLGGLISPRVARSNSRTRKKSTLPLNIGSCSHPARSPIAPRSRLPSLSPSTTTTRSPQPGIPPMPRNHPPATRRLAPINLTVRPMPNCRQLSRPTLRRFALLDSGISSPLEKLRKSFRAESSLVPTSRTHVLSLPFPLIKRTAWL